MLPILSRDLSQLPDAKTAVEKELFPDEKRVVKKKLSREILEKLFFYDDKIDPKESDLKSHFWNPSTITECKNEQSELISNFINCILENLNKNKHPKEFEFFSSILDENQILKSVNLLEVKNNLDSIKLLIAKHLGEVYSDIEKSILRYCEKKALPLRFSNLIEITKMYGHRKNALTLIPTLTALELSRAVREFIDIGLIEAAIETEELFVKLKNNGVFSIDLINLHHRTALSNIRVFFETKGDINQKRRFEEKIKDEEFRVRELPQTIHI